MVGIHFVSPWYDPSRLTGRKNIKYLSTFFASGGTGRKEKQEQRSETQAERADDGRKEPRRQESGTSAEPRNRPEFPRCRRRLPASRGLCCWSRRPVIRWTMQAFSCQGNSIIEFIIHLFYFYVLSATKKKKKKIVGSERFVVVCGALFYLSGFSHFLRLTGR